jgi:HK97 family phage major capsid protein
MIRTFHDFDPAEAQAEQQRLVDATQVILEQASSDGRDITPEERRQIRQHTDRCEMIGEQLRAQEAMAQSAGRRTEPDPAPGARHARPERAEQDQCSSGRAISGPPTYARMFGQARGNDGWRDGGEFLRALCLGSVSDPRFQAASTEDVGTSGGYLVPPALMAEIFDTSLSQEIVRPMARVFPMASSALTISGLDTEDQSTRRRVAALRMQMLAQLATGDDQTPKFRSLTLHARTGRVYTRASAELVQDSPNFSAQLVEGFAAALAQGLDDQFIRGTGAGEALGILNAPATISVDEESGQSADSITYGNILAMYARMYPPSIGRAVWMVHPSVIPQMLQFSVNGTAATGATLSPVITQLPNGSFMMLGRPVVVTHLCPPVGDRGDVMFVDWGSYAVGLRRMAAIERNMFSGWQQFAEDFRLVVRFDGLPLYSEPITLPDNAPTASPFVVMAERS